MIDNLDFCNASYQPVVIGVAADPIPDDAISLHDREGAIAETDPRRIDILLAFQLLELKSRMGGIVVKKAPGTFGIALNIERQPGKQTPELASRP